MTNKEFHVVYCKDTRGGTIYVHGIDDMNEIGFTSDIKLAMHMNFQEAARMYLRLEREGYDNPQGRIDMNVRNEIVRSLVYN